jgi:hypothetical protein
MQVVIIDLNILLQHLDANKFSRLWSRLIGLLVESDPTAKALSDASYAGIGGRTPWSFLLMWRITLEHP